MLHTILHNEAQASKKTNAPTFKEKGAFKLAFAKTCINFSSLIQLIRPASASNTAAGNPVWKKPPVGTFTLKTENM